MTLGHVLDMAGTQTPAWRPASTNSSGGGGGRGSGQEFFRGGGLGSKFAGIFIY